MGNAHFKQWAALTSLRDADINIDSIIPSYNATVINSASELFGKIGVGKRFVCRQKCLSRMG